MENELLVEVRAIDLEKVLRVLEPGQTDWYLRLKRALEEAKKNQAPLAQKTEQAVSTR